MLNNLNSERIMNWKYREDFLKDLNKENEEPNNYYDLYDYKKWLEKEVERLRNLVSGAKQSSSNCNIPPVSNRFSINKTILSDFALFAIIDNEQNKVVCHLVYDNGEQYCDEMANKMLAGLNGC